MSNRLILNSIVFKEQLDQGISQSQLIAKVAQLGVHNFEIRREFLTKINEELQLIKAQADKHHIALFYSINEDLIVNHQINPLLDTFIEEAQLLQAPFIKLNIGDASQISIEQLSQLSDITVPIRVENNQTLGHANIDNCAHMMTLCQQANLPISFVFDTANWVFVGDDVEHAIATMAASTHYLHCKNYQMIADQPQVTQSLFTGEIDIPQLFKRFKSVDYYALEYGSQLDILAEDIEKIVSML